MNGNSKKLNANGSYSGDNPSSTAEDRAKYIKAWQEMMITIWHEKISRLKVIDTGRLYGGITGSVISAGGNVQTVMHKFLEYGIYQDCGTGRGYNKGNGGYLEFMDKTSEKYNRGGGKHRQPREWFSRSYFASVMVLKEQMTYMYAEEFTGLVIDAVSNADTKKSTSMRSYLWGHHGHR